MTPTEQDAFVEAYAKNVACIHPTKVAAFVEQYAKGEDTEYLDDYANIMDALLMWNDGIKWQLEQSRNALTLALAELKVTATDTDSGAIAIKAIESALGIKKRYRAVAVMRSYFALEIFADSYEEAMQIAKDKEGSEFESIDDSDWEIYDLEAYTG